jgi:hypothetical protein
VSEPEGLPGSRLAWGALAAAALVLVNAAYVVSSLGVLHKPRKVLETDHFVYLEMARGPEAEATQARKAPFCWRVLTPWLVRLLSRCGLGLNAAFYLLTNLFLFAFLFSLYLYLIESGCGQGLAMLGIALAGFVQGAVRWYEYQYWMTDPLCLFLVMLAFRWILRGRDAALVALGVVGVLARETYLLVFVPWILGAARTRRAGTLARALLGALVALGVLALLRESIVPGNDPDTLRTAQHAVEFRIRHFFDNQAYLLSVGSLGVLFPMALLSPSGLRAWLRTRYDEAAYLLCVYLSLAMGNNTERLLAYALPVAVPLALRQLERFAKEARAPLAVLAAACLVLQVVVWTQTRLLGEQGLSAFQPANGLVAAALAAFWLACMARLWLASRHAAGGLAT